MLELADGRTLAYREWGRPGDPVVVLCHPGTGTAIGWDVAAEAAGVRLVFPDRPGFGRSTFKPGMSILDWPADVAALMSHLGVDRFRVAGVSAATPYALACGVELDGQVESVGIIAGTVPLDDTRRTGIAALAVDDPSAAFAEIVAEQADVDHEADARRVRERPEPDGSLYARPEIQAALIAASEETYRQGPDGPSWDVVLRLRPWGFDLADVVTPCQWWHGSADPVVPLGRIERATAGLARHVVTVVDGAGHGVCITHVEPFLRDLAGRRNS